MLVKDVIVPLCETYGVDPSRWEEHYEVPVTVSRPSWSASLLKDRKQCNRKAWFKKASGVEIEEDGEESPFLKRGSDLHQAIEDYLLGKTDRPMDGLACANLKRIDEYKALVVQGKAEVERWMKWDLGRIGIFWGKIDVDHYKGFVDHKTTSKPERILSPEVLRRDIQCMAYAREKFCRTDFDKIEVTYDYYLTKGRANCTPVRFVVTREEAEEFWISTILPEIIGAFIDFQVESQSLIPANKDACRFCTYKDHCTVLLESAITKDDLKVPAQRSVEVETYTPDDGEVMGFDKNKFLAKVKARKAAAPEIETTAGDQPESDPTPKLPDSGREVTALDELGLTPTMVDALNSLGVDTPAEAALLVDDQLLEVKGFGPATLEAFRKIFPGPNSEDVEVDEGDDGDIKDTGEDEDKAPAWQKPEEVAQDSNDTPGTPDSCHIYLDCIPETGGFFLNKLEAFIEATATVAEKNEVPHYTCVEFGKGPGEVAARYCLSEDWKGRALLLSSDSAVDRLILNQLAPHASHIVRGI